MSESRKVFGPVIVTGTCEKCPEVSCSQESGIIVCCHVENAGTEVGTICNVGEVSDHWDYDFHPIPESCPLPDVAPKVDQLRCLQCDGPLVIVGKAAICSDCGANHKLTPATFAEIHEDVHEGLQAEIGRPSRPLAKILQAITAERERQKETWGTQAHPNPIWLAILTEEVGEVAKAVVEAVFDEEPFTEEIQHELVQTAAVCVAWLEKLGADQKQGDAS